MKLYEISNEYQKIIDLIEECGEITPELAEMLKNNSLSAEDKIKNTAARVKNLSDNLESMDKYIADMEKRRLRALKEIEWHEGYLKEHMDIMQIKKVETPELSVSLRENKYKLDLFDESLIPKEYIRLRETSMISRQDIIKDLKVGCDVPGARFITSKSVQIR